MPHPITGETRCQSRRARDFGGLYVALMILSFHWALMIYIHSSFLSQYFNDKTVSALYILGAAISILLFLSTPHILKTLGTFRTLTLCTGIEAVSVFLLPEVQSRSLVALLFLIHQSMIPILLFMLDMYMESLTGNCEKDTGGRRGLFLTVMSLATASSALISGYLIGEGTENFAMVYTVSALLLIPFYGIAYRSLRTIHPKTHDPLHAHGLRARLRESDIRNVLGAHFLLQIFFAWMVIYSSLYLHTALGYSWPEIGKILFVGLMAYVLLEYIIGVIADTKIGEKEMMVLGFFILIIATSWFSFLGSGTVVLWMIAMFMTRVGASLVEVTTESYFFKHTDDSDAALVSFFRLTRPLAVLIGALLGSITLFFIPMQLMFVLLAFLLIPGLFFTMQLKDTK